MNPGFSIALHKKDEKLLRKIQAFFGGIGVLKVKKYIIQFRVFSIKDLDIILKHFNLYPLITKKLADYLLFKEAVELIKNKEHLTLEGFNKIISIRASMNKGLTETLKTMFPDIIPVVRPIVDLQVIKNPLWLVGFVDGEGCFYIKIKKNKV